MFLEYISLHDKCIFHWNISISFFPFSFSLIVYRLLVLLLLLQFLALFLFGVIHTECFVFVFNYIGNGLPHFPLCTCCYLSLSLSFAPTISLPQSFSSFVFFCSRITQLLQSSCCVRMSD